jgi:tetratricopeptide (TPR) repeat protein
MNTAHPPSPPAADTALRSARQRLARLEDFLQSDPHNNALLVDAFEAALACGEWEHAHRHLQSGRTNHEDALGWQLREGDYWLAQHNAAAAREVLQALRAKATDNPEILDVLAHNLAYIDFQQGLFAQCVDGLRVRMETAPPAAPSSGQMSLTAQALQTLWLRALHQTGETEAAFTWAVQAEQAGQLAPTALGIAALIAIDADQMQSAQRWSTQALEQAGTAGHIESMVAQGTLALGRGDTATALQAAEQALLRHPDDGRTWSLKAFAHLQAQDLPAATQSFDRAVRAIPDHIGTWIGRGWTLLLQSAPASAQQSFEAALALDRNFGESHGSLAVALAQQGLREPAQQHAELAARLDNHNLSGQFAQALLRGEVHDRASVLEWAQRVLGARGLGGWDHRL